jgi:formate dehydrogenase subunit delta
MAMRAEGLVRMANQIAHFFAPYPHDDAVESVRDHLAKFWDPGMRKELLNIASGLVPSAEPLHALVVRAVERLRRDVDE